VDEFEGIIQKYPCVVAADIDISSYLDVSKYMELYRTYFQLSHVQGDFRGKNNMVNLDLMVAIRRLGNRHAKAEATESLVKLLTKGTNVPRLPVDIIRVVRDMLFDTFNVGLSVTYPAYERVYRYTVTRSHNV